MEPESGASQSQIYFFSSPAKKEEENLTQIAARPVPTIEEPTLQPKFCLRIQFP